MWQIADGCGVEQNDKPLIFDESSPVRREAFRAVGCRDMSDFGNRRCVSSLDRRRS